MLFSRKSIGIFFIINIMTAGWLLTVSPSISWAESHPRRTLKRAPAQSQIQPNRNWGILASLQGKWKGNIQAPGDDILTHLEMIVDSKSGSNYQGTWKHLGSKYNYQNASWENAILQQGTLKASRQGNEVTLELNGFNGDQIILVGVLTPSQISGEVLETSHLVFSLKKF